MSDEREENEKSVAAAATALPSKTASTVAMTLASAALETHSNVAAGQQQQQQHQEQQQQQQQQQVQHEMPTTSYASGSARGGLARYFQDDMRELGEIQQLLWGDNVLEDVFNRWSQGFEFSDVEPSALVQKQGGPCAVIAPVQAYLLKIIIMDMPSVKLTELTPDRCQSLLIQALCNILKNCRAPRYRIVTLLRRRLASEGGEPTKERHQSEETPTGDDAAVDVDEASNIAAGAAAPPTGSASATAAAAVAAANTVIDLTQGSSNSASINSADVSGGAGLDMGIGLGLELTPNEFHDNLRTVYFDDIKGVARYYDENYSQLSNTYGVLIFMYSVFLTKGIEQVTAEISDTSESLIHNTYGYGAQSLINLMLTGRAVAHVWDNEQDVGGLKLRGICEQSDIGFITLMEQMRYCTVGSFFKNPRFPVWVMGSDTHLTVLFSKEKRLVSPETPSETGRRIFKSFDPEGNNFISSSVLRDVLAALNLVSEPAYVSLMTKRLDPENLGIILLNAFMDEFFPLERRSTPDTFELMHYNGIPGSNENNKVRYYCGSAILLEGDLKSICTSNPMVTCLQTKWPNIEINWHDAHMPSLN
ncbi:ubiquitin carboxyl-terminal hydrolase MINDY-3 homolog [Scaptodrosophila lebanonensis]|uniref:Ubiquitin carboxyl-terminal hydrolase MINDY n=1 Tax=Drosophila lebanonensis TaxID=7225 RepID=A0A6J2U640_DROLE|nr:ubiquitin carboxyl-terminal hydrolase MINDY-3 homolog [Scaptodrosophila lebanonensis]